MKLNRVQKVDDTIEIRNAIVSVADKRGLDDFIPRLTELCTGISIFSTGGSYTAIEEILGSAGASRHLRKVSDYTGQPEMQGGLVKTLDYRIYLGLLSETYNSAHQEDLKRTHARAFDLLVVNLYPFREAVSASGATIEDARTHIDIGGPCMLRAGAKNYLRVATVCDPRDYPVVLEELKKGGGRLSLATRFRLAGKAFQLTAEYDSHIAAFFAGRDLSEPERFYAIQKGGKDG